MNVWISLKLNYYLSLSRHCQDKWRNKIIFECSFWPSIFQCLLKHPFLFLYTTFSRNKYWTEGIRCVFDLATSYINTVLYQIYDAIIPKMHLYFMKQQETKNPTFNQTMAHHQNIWFQRSKKMCIFELMKYGNFHHQKV